MQYAWADALKVDASGRFVPLIRTRSPKLRSVKLISMQTFATAAEAIAYGARVMGILDRKPAEVF